MLTKSCSKVRYEKKELPAGQSYVDSVYPLFATPSATLRSFMSDDLSDPDAPQIRSAIGALPETSSSSESLPLPVRSLKRKVIASSRRKKTSKKPLIEDVPSDTDSDDADEETLSSRVQGKKPEIDVSVPRKVLKRTIRKSVKGLSPKPAGFLKKTKVVTPDRAIPQSSVPRTSDTPVISPTPDASVEALPKTPLLPDPPIDEVAIVVSDSSTLPEVVAGPSVSPSREVDPFACETGNPLTDVPEIALSLEDVVNEPEMPLVTPPSSVATDLTAANPSSKLESASVQQNVSLSDDDSPFLMSTFVGEMSDITSPTRPVIEIPNVEQTYVPGWEIKVSDDLNTTRTCLELINHFAPPAVVNQLRGLADPIVGDEVAQSLTRSIAVTAEYMRRWGEREAFTQALQRRGSELEKRVAIRTGEVNLLEDKLRRQKESKDLLLKKYASLLHENTSDRSTIIACTSEIEKLKKELEEKVSQPMLVAGQVVVDGKLLIEKDDKIRALEKRIADAESANIQLTDWHVERSRLKDQLDLVGRTCEGLKADYTWIVENGIKEFVHNLLSSSEFLVQRSRLCLLARNAGFAEGMREGHRLGRQKVPLSEAPNYDPAAVDVYDEASASDSTFDFPYLNALASNANQPLEVLRGVLPKNPSM